MLSIPTDELVGTIADVLPFAAADKELPDVHAVKIEWDGDRLHAYATDRYMAGWSRWHPGDDPTPDHTEGEQDGLFDDWGSADDPWSFMIPQPDAAEIVKIFKLPAKVDRIPLELDVEFPKVTVRRRKGQFSAITYQFDAPVGLEPPDVASLLDRARISSLTDYVSWDPRRLALFAKVRYHGPAKFYIDGTEKLTLIEIGDRFTGALAPTRLNDDAAPPDGPSDE